MSSKDTVDSSPDQYMLPRDTFSEWYYILNTYKVLSALLAVELLFFGYLFCFKVRTGGAAVFTLMAAAVSATVTGGLTYESSRNVGLTDENKLVFLKEVTVARPGLDCKRWDAIAGRLNPIFYQNCRIASPHFFYDGKDCDLCFRRNFLGPYYSRQTRPRQDAEREVTNPSESRRTRGLHNGSINSGPPRSELDAFVEMAVKAHEECITAYWNELEVGSSPSN